MVPEEYGVLKFLKIGTLVKGCVMLPISRLPPGRGMSNKGSMLLVGVMVLENRVGPAALVVDSELQRQLSATVPRLTSG